VKTVVVIGGGPAGSAAAITLARGGALVTLVVAETTARPAMVESLPPQTSRMLRELGVWDAFLAMEPKPSPGNLSLWGDDIPRATDFIFNPYGNGWHIERSRFDVMLLDEARQAGAIVIAGRARRVLKDAEAWTVLVQRAEGTLAELSPDVVVWACGRSSPMPAAFSAQRRKFDSLMAVATIMPTGDSRRDTRAWTEAVPEGWWYAGPELERQHFIAFFTDADLIPARDRTAWWQSGLSSTRLIARRAGSAPARLYTLCAHASIAEPVDAGSWFSVGDAALAFDPLSSAGVNFALSSGKYVGDALLGFRPSAAYADWVARQCSRYLREVIAVYQRESRWPRSMFWKRRTSRVKPNNSMQRTALRAAADAER
jgi:flavin-dependent dehydrogenase